MGTVPYHEASFLGGPATLRGYRNQRFTGESSLFLGSELRLFLGDVVFLLPVDLGVLALGDVGRVFVDGEASDTWHGAVGLGAWLTFLDVYSATLALARGEVTGIYLTVTMRP